MYRRAILLSGVSLVGSLAGCSSVVNELTQTSEQLDSEPPPLYEIAIENWQEKPHTVYLLIHHSGEIIHWSEYEMQSATRQDDGYTFYDRQKIHSSDWPTCTGSFRIDVSMNDRSTWAQLDTDELDSGDYGTSIALAVKVEISPENGLNILPGKTYYECSDTVSTEDKRTTATSRFF